MVWCFSVCTRVHACVCVDTQVTRPPVSPVSPKVAQLVGNWVPNELSCQTLPLVVAMGWGGGGQWCCCVVDFGRGEFGAEKEEGSDESEERHTGSASRPCTGQRSSQSKRHVHFSSPTCRGYVSKGMLRKGLGSLFVFSALADKRKYREIQQEKGLHPSQVPGTTSF